MAIIGNQISEAKQLLEAGKLVAIPTETVYGLAANALDQTAVAGIFEVKNRPSFDPIIVHVSSLEKANQYVQSIPANAKLLTEKFWPGPLTILLHKKEIIPDLVTAGLETVGIRCPDHSLTLALLNALDFPLAAPSANPFGYVSPTEPQHVVDQLGDKIPYILDGGVCSVGIESTIVGFENDIPVIYRLGGLSQEEIEKVIGPVNVKTHSSSNPKAPGQLKSHYAPGKKVKVGNLTKMIQESSTKNFGVLSFQKDYQQNHQFILSPSGEMKEAAQRFFKGLRELDKMPIDIILTELVPDKGLGRAINDKLRRSSADKLI